MGLQIEIKSAFDMRSDINSLACQYNVKQYMVCNMTLTHGHAYTIKAGV